MTIDKLILDNFAVFGGRQEILLTPPSSRRPIILIGGLNGCGKTTLLDSIHLVLYGSRARTSNRGRRSYKNYLSQTIHHGADRNEGAVLELHFRRVTDGQEHSYRVIRAWRENSKGEIEETLEVSRDGAFDPVLSEHWDEFIESYIPLDIAPLFFFDGEQIKDLAEDENTARLLKTAVNSLLGLDLVDRLENDLLVLERRKKAEESSNEELAKLKESEKEVEVAEELMEQAVSEQGSLQNRLDRKQKELNDLESEFRQRGGSLLQQRDDLSKEKSTLEKELGTVEDALLDLASGSCPLLLVSDLLGNVAKQASFEEAARRDTLLAEAEEERDKKILRSLKRKGFEKAAMEAVEASLLRFRPKRDQYSEEDLYLGSDDGFAAELEEFLSQSVPKTRDQARDLSRQARDLRERLARLQDKLSAVPDSDVLEELHQQLAIKQNEVDEQNTALAAVDDKVKHLTAKLAEAKRFRQRLLHVEIHDMESRKLDQRILSHSPRVRETLVKLRQRTLNRNAAKLEKLMLDSLRQLLRKDTLVNELHINPQSFRVSLLGSDSLPLDSERLSAGERQLLATAILWGLAKASGRPLPTIIDTPLGRLDASHRDHLSKRYFPQASHQVILLSTDKEVDATHLDQLSPYLGASYCLNFDPKENRTVIQDHYFEPYDAAS